MYNQDRLIEKINSLENLPHSILLIGDKGSGKQDICNYISTLHNLDIVNLTDNISLESLNEIYECTTSKIYLVNLDDTNIKEQNILLKTFEEPTEYMYFILTSSNKDYVIDTISTRSYLLEMIRNTKAELSQFVTSAEHKDLILSTCSTVGQIDIANHTDIDSLKKLCNNIICKMKNAAYYNVLTISSKINFSDEFTKFDLDLFFNVLRQTLILSINDFDKDYIAGLNRIIVKFQNSIRLVNNKEQHFERFLTTMWRFARDE